MRHVAVRGFIMQQADAAGREFMLATTSKSLASLHELVGPVRPLVSSADDIGSHAQQSIRVEQPSTVTRGDLENARTSAVQPMALVNIRARTAR